jgi:hypothetical protein
LFRECHVLLELETNKKKEITLLAQQLDNKRQFFEDLTTKELYLKTINKQRKKTSRNAISLSQDIIEFSLGVVAKGNPLKQPGMSDPQITDVLFDENNQGNDNKKINFSSSDLDTSSTYTKKSEKNNGSKSLLNDDHELIWSTKHNNVNSGKSFTKDIRKYLKNSK